MSTTRSPPAADGEPDTQWVDDRHLDVDPYDIVPPGFKQAYGNANSLAQAMRNAEAAESTTDGGEKRRCSHCQSVCLVKKRDRGIEHAREEQYRCSECGNHFNDPDPSKEKSMPGERVTLDQL